MKRNVVAALGLGLLISGCGMPPAPMVPTGGPDGTVVWMPSGDTREPVPGIDGGTAYAIGKAFVVWGDFTRGAGGSSGSIGSRGAEGGGYMDSHDGRKVEFRYAIGDGKTGRVTLDGVDYDLANGNVFLVRAAGPRHRVMQLVRDLVGLKMEPGYFKSLAASDEEIRAFFTDADDAE